MSNKNNDRVFLFFLVLWFVSMLTGFISILKGMEAALLPTRAWTPDYFTAAGMVMTLSTVAFLAAAHLTKSETDEEKEHRHGLDREPALSEYDAWKGGNFTDVN